MHNNKKNLVGMGVFDYIKGNEFKKQTGSAHM